MRGSLVRQLSISAVLILPVGCRDASGGGEAEGGSGESGGDGDEGGSDGEALSCDEPTPGPSPIRRLSSFEYDNTIRDLLGDDSRPSQTLSFPEEGAGGFDNNADAAVVTFIVANKYMLAAEDVATRAVADAESLLPCANNESKCVGEFIEDWGQRAWRRPLSDEEQADMMALYNANREDFSVHLSLSALVQAFLQSPHFLYRVEFGTGEGDADVVPLNDWEMASRLSYFLWGSMPDDELFDAARDGALSTPDEVAAQAERMLDDPRARDMVAHFHDQWLGLRRLATVDKDVTVFPEWTQEIGELQAEQAKAFLDHVMFEDDGNLATLLTADYTFADPTLAAFYGWEAPSGDGMSKITPDQDLSGVLSLGGLMSAYSNSGATNPITRGLFVRQQLFCQHPPPPPVDADTTLPTPEPGSTTRELFEQHRADPACAACHVLLDPIGFGFEHYDAVGRFRTTDNGQPVDASGELAQTDVDGTFDGVAELGDKLAQSQDVAACTATNWFRFAQGRAETETDACNIEHLTALFDESGHDVRALLVGLTQLDSFRYRPAFEGGQ